MSDGLNDSGRGMKNNVFKKNGRGIETKALNPHSPSNVHTRNYARRNNLFERGERLLGYRI
jgi:hypothetical protein